VYPIIIHAVSPEEYFAVVASQVVVDGKEALGLQFKKTGVDELYHIVSTQTGEGGKHFGQITQTVPLALSGAYQRNVAFIILPEVTMGDNAHMVPKGAKPLGQCPMDVAVFSKQKYFHSVFL
jgi:hypothetical protein